MQQVTLQQRLRAFVIKSRGTYNEVDMLEFQDLLKSRNIEISGSDLLIEINKTQNEIRLSDKKVFICSGGPCKKIDTHEAIATHFGQLDSERTICQWGCKNAPVVTIKDKSKWRRLENYSINDENLEEQSRPDNFSG
jgi:hypothetical protein